MNITCFPLKTLLRFNILVSVVIVACLEPKGLTVLQPPMVSICSYVFACGLGLCACMLIPACLMQVRKVLAQHAQPNITASC